MSKNVLGNPKRTLAFVGVVAASAVVISLGAGSFVTPSGPNQYERAAAEQEAQAATEKPAEEVAVSGWSDDGLSDDWNVGPAASSQGGNGFSQGASELDVDFGDYEPEDSGSSSTNSFASRGRGGSESGPNPNARDFRAPSTAVGDRVPQPGEGF
ncbi:3-hydroxybutyryl-CoA dehydrogenase [Erythrobacter sp. NAP1]|uniref:hypothetical protein n=1 Tax=Erythrobacter sp. NAP1 TaxID=237727 RepID=UPI000068781F|nr:hypothetical protein [Erythrobacter sp. NAP1]EAQ28306.1 3-hydroxybutyryl-CoA dehydrogenase [Erythrobacter sp. NAP1]